MIYPQKSDTFGGAYYFHVLCSFAVRANRARPRAFTERPYEDDFLSVGKTCFIVGTPNFYIQLNFQFITSQLSRCGQSARNLV